MKKLFLALIFILISFETFAACTGSSPTWTTDGNEWADVSECITAATAGDTINVIAGDNAAIWNRVTITKGVKLIGPGAGNLTITGQFTYTPANPSADSPFEISGFSVNCDNVSSCIALSNVGTTYPQTKIVIGNNIFSNAPYPILGTNGPYYGVFHSNTVTGTAHFDMYSTNNCAELALIHSADPDIYALHGINPGSALNFYIEDNHFDGYLGTAATSAAHGGRSSFRYNTYTYVGATRPVPWFDAHGNQPANGVPVGGILVEHYGNLITGTFNGDLLAFDLRGGVYRVFYNQVTANRQAYLRNREDQCDISDVSAYQSCNAYVQRIHDSYNWTNIANTTPFWFTWYTNCTTETMVENENFWNYKGASFNGTAGTGCGNAAAFAAFSGNCTQGVAYWVTDQSCSDLTGMVGAVDAAGDRPDTSYKITGTLYKCTANNVWQAYYTPYAYPHPLRTGETPVDGNPPIFYSAAINGSGNRLEINLNEDVAIQPAEFPDPDNTGFELTCAGGPAGLDYLSESNGKLLYAITGRVIQQAEGNCSLDHTSVANGIQDAAGNDLASFTGGVVVNGSLEQTIPTVTLTLNIVGNGHVVSSPAGINSATSTSAEYDSGTVVTLGYYIPSDKGWYFAGYSGDCAANGTVTVNAAKTCTATFAQIQRFP